MKTIEALIVGATIMLTGCGGRDLVGTWTSAPHGSELGTVVETLVISPNGSCVYSIADAKHPEDEMVTTSKWTRSGSAILIQTDKAGQGPLRLTIRGASALSSDGGIEFRKE